MATSVDDESDQLEEDYYTFLNLPVNASQEEITNAYRRLSRIYHPDKHADPIRKKEAEILFNKTKKAYEVLRDPHKRAIYDNLGTKGLETEGWEIVQRTKTPQEIREEYERLAREREERRLQQRTNPRGSVTVSINASDIFNPYDEEYYEYRNSWLPIIEVKGMSFTQSIEAPLTMKDTALMSGMGYQMNKSTMGYLSYKAGGQSSMSTTLVCDSPHSNVQTSLVLGIPHSYFSLTYVHKFEKHEGRLRGSIKMLARRREAEAAVDLMRETYRRIVEDEENRRGLIITKGIYGRWLELGSRNSGDAIVDVTIPLQCLVKDSKLILHEPSKVFIIDIYM
nr:EOG090X03AJ [Eulimnadia texana]